MIILKLKDKSFLVFLMLISLMALLTFNTANAKENPLVPNTLVPGDKFKVKLDGVVEMGDDGYFTGKRASSHAHTVETFGGMKGSIKGAHKLRALMLHAPDELPSPILRGIGELASPNYVLSPHNSKYFLIFEGTVLNCCSENFLMKGTFKTCQATGRFTGTIIEGTWESTGDFSFDNKIVMEGRVLADKGNNPSCNLVDVSLN